MESGDFPCPSQLKENNRICFILIFKTDFDSGLLWRDLAVLLINVLKSGHVSRRKGRKCTSFCYLSRQ